MVVKKVVKEKETKKVPKEKSTLSKKPSTEKKVKPKKVKEAKEKKPQSSPKETKPKKVKKEVTKKEIVKKEVPKKDITKEIIQDITKEINLDKKKEELKKDDSKKEESKIENSKRNDSRIEEFKKDDFKIDDSKMEESKSDDSKIKESKKEEFKIKEPKKEELKKEEPLKVEDKKVEDKKSEEIIGKQSQINIGMIGHVDHGKTSLTRAISAKWCDTHSEEMKRGISIRLGYADVTFYKLDTSNGIVYSNKPEYQGQKAKVISKRNVSFVDAPGHETLMTTMLSGAALMNGAVLVIAANEMCPQPRTIEHLMALKFAGVEHIVVAQNKVDLITKEQAIENYKSIRQFLDDYGYTKAPIIPTAATFNVNIDSLIEAIETNIPTPKFDEDKPLKMYIARSFDINKPGTPPKNLKGAIIGGSITQGKIAIGDLIELNPGLKGKTLIKVESVSTSSGLVKEAHAGGLIAIGTDLDPSVAQNDQLRGQIASKPGVIPLPVKELKINYNMFERMLNQDSKQQSKNTGSSEVNDSTQKIVIKVTEPLVMTVGTNTVIGFVTKIDAKTITLNLKNEAIAEKGERVAISKNINGQWRLVAYGEII